MIGFGEIEIRSVLGTLHTNSDILAIRRFLSAYRAPCARVLHPDTGITDTSRMTNINSIIDQLLALSNEELNSEIENYLKSGESVGFFAARDLLAANSEKEEAKKAYRQQAEKVQELETELRAMLEVSRWLVECQTDRTNVTNSLANYLFTGGPLKVDTTGKTKQGNFVTSASWRFYYIGPNLVVYEGEVKRQYNLRSSTTPEKLLDRFKPIEVQTHLDLLHGDYQDTLTPCGLLLGIAPPSPIRQLHVPKACKHAVVAEIVNKLIERVNSPGLIRLLTTRDPLKAFKDQPGALLVTVENGAPNSLIRILPTTRTCTTPLAPPS